MTTNLQEFRLCPNCGDTQFIENYPTVGTSTCTDCGYEIVTVPLNEMSKKDVRSQNCFFCGKESNQVETLYADDFVLVFKCKSCGKLRGYTSTLNPYGDEELCNDDDYKAMDRAVARKEGKYVVDMLSASKRKELIKSIKKTENDPILKCENYLFHLLGEKTPQLKAVGISKQTLDSALMNAQYYVKNEGAQTEKQLRLLICGSISYAEEIDFRRRDITKRLATERFLAELFNVDRKTIRKWKNVLEKREKPSIWGVDIFQENGVIESGKFEFPKDIQAVTKLEKPYKGSCSFLGRTSSLIWRIKYTNGGWSDICQSAYETFKRTYWESQGSLELP
jgi:hypothetical protein